jgi:hypothetical protein
MSQIPKGLYVFTELFYIQSLRDFWKTLVLLSYKHIFPSGIGTFIQKKDVGNGQGFKPA